MRVSEKYRAKALACEKLGKYVQDPVVKREWAEIAIEWHCLAGRAAEEVGQDREIEVSFGKL